MKSIPVLAAVLAIALHMPAHCATQATDPLTKLPLPADGTALQLYGNPNTIDDVPVCKSKGTMNMYSGRTGTVSVALAWYASHLSGFKRAHGYGSGRSQDTFYNAGGTLIVAITRSPAPDGQDTQVYSVLYGSIQPGASEKVIAGMNIQKVVCP